MRGQMTEPAMDEAFWVNRWKRRQIGFHENEVNVHLRTFWPVLNAVSSATVFVPLCGKSRDMLWLRDRGHPVIGVELSRLAVDAFFSENNLSARWRKSGSFDICEGEGIRILCGNFFDLTSNDVAAVTAVYDRAALVALPPVMQDAYVAHNLRLFNRGTRVLLVTLEFEQNETDGPPFSIPEADVQRLYDSNADVCLLARQQTDRVFMITLRSRHTN